ncbi:UDP-N-acetylmuramate dehydrogenase [Bacteroides sp. 224]|uniref:UDP-N-acetylmuramate dehydrogenase n=1 Tax=Bacteroides sp. 224 TaxID=2302936 RepID=UPI0013D2732A|nr:UDP-N-acetylmuramate dehydrogenase [Bacteroides sp. 224]NDV65769.1 UDP-N-acetylmuramate dehydrogenase [Bacteroides sp. 224]
MIREYENYSLLSHNTFGIDIKAAHFIEYDSVEELQQIIHKGTVKEPYIHIGGGSNLLFTKDYEGLVLHSCIKEITKIEETEDTVTLRVGSGIVWDDFVACCVENEWYGAENLSNIPGEVGASAVQNVGAYGVEAKDIIKEVELLSVKGEKAVFSASDCQFSYRHSIFKKPEMKGWFVTRISFILNKKPVYKLEYGAIREELKKYPEVTLAAVRKAIFAIRSAKLPDPAVLGNAGSFFMNPMVDRNKFEELKEIYPQMPFYEVDSHTIKIPAAWMIEQCGWKGKALGPVAMYEKQALVLVNRGGASGEDVISLSNAVRASVREKFGVDINPEVKFVS